MTTQFCAALDGTKCPPLLIFKGALAPESGMPRNGTIAKELIDREQHGAKYPAEAILSCNPKAYAYEAELVLTLTEQMKALPRPLIVNCDDYKCHKSERLKQVAEENNMTMYNTKGGLTPKFQLMDIAANAIVHQHVENENMGRMLKSPLDARGYPICMTRVELARSVCEGWAKVTREVLLRSAIKCGIARWFDYSPDEQERMGLRKVKIDPIIADLVSNEELPIFDTTVLDPLNLELCDLGDILGLDPEIEEDREELENIRFAQESLVASREAADQDLNAEELDIDRGMESVVHAAAEEERAEEEEVAPKRKKREQYSVQQLEVLNREFLKDAGRMKNEEIAKEISGLDGARTVTTADVRGWMSNARRARRAPA